ATRWVDRRSSGAPSRAVRESPRGALVQVDARAVAPRGADVLEGSAASGIVEAVTQSASLRARAASEALEKRAARRAAAARANHASSAAGSVTPRARARATADSCGPRAAVKANAMMSPALLASGSQYGSPARRVYAIMASA